ncbi:MAG: hypothetical protein ACI91O_000826 [Candidatus Poriferisodalaceae bacterium]
MGSLISRSAKAALAAARAFAVVATGSAQAERRDGASALAVGDISSTTKFSDAPGALPVGLADSDSFGASVIGIGDLDGDGREELAVGAPGSDRVRVLFLNADGTVSQQNIIGAATMAALPSGIPAADTAGTEFGAAVAGIGDLNLDGVTDVAVGAHGDDDGGPDGGAVHMILLSAAGTPLTSTKISNTEGGFHPSLPDGSRFGESLAWLGDHEKDGVSDVAVGAPGDHENDPLGVGPGTVFVVHLNLDGSVLDNQQVGLASDAIGPDLSIADGFGSSIAAPGDLNGDDIRDLVIGSPGDDGGGPGTGAMYLVTLTAAGSTDTYVKVAGTTPALAPNIDDGDRFGRSIARLGNISDSTMLLLVGAVANDDGGLDRGAVWTVRVDVALADGDGDGLANVFEDNDLDGDPTTNPGPGSDSDGLAS